MAPPSPFAIGWTWISSDTSAGSGPIKEGWISGRFSRRCAVVARSAPTRSPSSSLFGERMRWRRSHPASIASSRR